MCSILPLIVCLPLFCTMPKPTECLEEAFPCLEMWSNTVFCVWHITYHIHTSKFTDSITSRKTSFLRYLTPSPLQDTALVNATGGLGAPTSNLWPSWVIYLITNTQILNVSFFPPFATFHLVKASFGILATQCSFFRQSVHMVCWIEINPIPKGTWHDSLRLTNVHFSYSLCRLYSCSQQNQTTVIVDTSMVRHFCIKENY